MAQGVHLDAARIFELQEILAGNSFQEGARIARERGFGQRAISQHRQKLLEAGFASITKQPPPQARTAIQSVDFWRGKANRLEKELASSEHLIAELNGLHDIERSVPDWLVPTPDGRHERIVPVLLSSDFHVGEVIFPDQLDGINAYDVPTFRKRYQQLIDATSEIGKSWIGHRSCPGIVYVRGGDTISGDIHAELRETNALTAHQQLIEAVEQESAGIRHLADTFGAVFVPSIPGNHGRITIKPVAKQYAATNYDTVIAEMLRREFRDDDRVSFLTPASGDALFPILGWQFLFTHGDRMGSRGGQGFIGPMATIIRGLRKLRDEQSRIGRPIDYVGHGHFHTTGNPYETDFANGSLCGFNEFAHSIRAAPEPPQQWLFAVHGRWGVRERLPVKLAPPKKMDRPVVRVPAGMGEHL